MSLGALITNSRTAARLSLDQLAALTNIPTSLLREMENDNFNKCGGETYARGHLRNIAAKLQVDERTFLDLFEIEVAAPVKPIRELLSENNVTVPYKEPKNVSWKVLAAGSLTALLLFGLAQVIFSIASDDPVITISPSVKVSESAKPEITESAGPISANAVTIDIRATRGASWLYAFDKDGTQVFSGLLSKGDSKRLSDPKQLNLRVGNAGGVDINVNGKEVGLIGADGEVVNLTYNAD